MGLSNQKGIIGHVLLIVILILGLIVGVYLIKNPTIFKSKAANPPILDALKITDTADPPNELNCNGAVNPPSCEITSPDVIFTIKDIDALIPNNSGSTSNLFQFPKQVFAQENSVKTCAEGNCNACETQTITVCGDQNAYAGDCDFATACKNNPTGKYTCRSRENPNGCSFDQYDCSACNSSVTGKGYIDSTVSVPAKPATPTTQTCAEGNCNACQTQSISICGNQNAYAGDCDFETACKNNPNGKYTCRSRENPNGCSFDQYDCSLCDSSVTDIEKSPSPTASPTLTVSSLMLDINGSKTTLGRNYSHKAQLPISDLTLESTIPIRVDVTYSDGSSQPFYITFHYKPKKNEAGETIHITSCQEITKPGNYVLDNDLIGSSGSVKCLSINNTRDINLDCNGHKITLDVPSNQRKAIGPVLEIKNVSSFSVKSCNISILLNPSKIPVRPFSLINTSQGVLINNIIGFYQVNVSNSSDIQIINNSFNSTLDIIESSNITVQGNSLTNRLTSNQTPDRTAAGVISISESSVTIEDNKIDGGSDGIRYLDESKRNGADDGIYIPDGGEKIVIKNNTIINNWDCGIEPTGLMKYSVISGNKIKNAGVCGIGAWHSNSWIGNTIENNIVEDSPMMFLVYRDRKLTPGESSVYFTDNVFTGNRFLNQRKESSDYYGASTVIYMVKEVDDLIPTDKFIVNNNIFKDNDFGKNSPITLGPPFLGVIDGGGNICAPSFVDNFPLKCNDVASDTR